MAYRLPNFNIQCRVNRFVAGPYPPGGPVAGSVASVCQLATSHYPGQVFPTGFIGSKVLIKLPKLTDIRTTGPGPTNPDLVEVPLGSGLWYSVMAVQDIGKGFANEYRVAILSAMQTTLNLWVFPMP